MCDVTPSGALGPTVLPHMTALPVTVWVVAPQTSAAWLLTLQPGHPLLSAWAGETVTPALSLGWG